MIDKLRTAVDAKDNYDFRGEEGILYRVELDGGVFWAKKWHRSHNKGFYTPIWMGGSILSPFWHEAVKTAYRIVHDLFPDHTIDVCGSYDERLSGNIAVSRSFSPPSGRPVTVSREIQGDPEICAIRNQILGAYYRILISRRDEAAREHRTRDEMAPFFASWRADVNAAMIRILGPEIDMDSIIARVRTTGPEVLDEFARLIRERDGDNVMADLLKAGISTGHPEVNFIPCDRIKHPRPPHGKFVEFSIADVHRLADYITKRFAGNSSKRVELLQRLRSYQIYSLVDEMFDKIVPIYIQKTGGRFDQRSLGQICAALEKFRLITETLGDRIDPAVLQKAITTIVLRSGSHQEIIDRLENDVIHVLNRTQG